VKLNRAGIVDIFIPSYNRADNLRTVNYFLKNEYPAERLHVVVDDASEKEMINKYRAVSQKTETHLHIFSMEEARRRYDYVHRPSELRRSAGQARNMIFDIADKLSIDFYVVIDDDTVYFEIKKRGRYCKVANMKEITDVFELVKKFMKKRRIGLWGLSQTGDFIGGENRKLYRRKVMNTAFYNRKYIYRGERGVQDDDTSLFTCVQSEGLFTGSNGEGVLIKQKESAVQEGGLTDLYKECKLLNKSLVCPIQHPSAIWATKQERNGGRLHHHVNKRYLYPKLLKIPGGNDNIAWDTYSEDYPFTLEPKRDGDITEEE